MKKEQEIARFSALIPQRITVRVEKNKDEEGVWAKIMELPHCYTQATTISELPSMLTDLVFTHFEIPEEYRGDLGSYMPLSANHLQIEAVFRKLIEIEEKTDKGQEVSAQFERAELVACAS